MAYIQIPDADPAGVVDTAREFLRTAGVTDALPTDLRSLATRIGALCESGWVVALDEFQYFNRKGLFEFTSQLQAEVDRLSSRPHPVAGGLVVLGSLYAEMAALLEERSAPLYNRVTDTVDLGHLDVRSLLDILEAHGNADPEQLLFLWNLFEGVPKFYRDCYEHGVLGADRKSLIRAMFFGVGSPLRTEAENWFLRELRGRFDLVLKYVSTHPGCSNADLEAFAASGDAAAAKLAGAYVKILTDRYQMIERLQPVLASASSRNGRLYVRDNFLRAWLGALAVPVAATAFRPVDVLVDEADARLAHGEGHGLERLVRTLYEERSRAGSAEFPLTSVARGWWDRAGTELDLVAVDSVGRRVRLGTCKRSAAKLIADLPRFDAHVARFLQSAPRFASWTVERVAIAPRLDAESRRACAAAGYLAEDLADLTRDL